MYVPYVRRVNANTDSVEIFKIPWKMLVLPKEMYIVWKEKRIDLVKIL